MSFGANLKWWRTHAGMTQADLAQKIRVKRKPTTPSYISRLESGRLQPSLPVVRSLARALHLQTWQLFVTLEESGRFWAGYQRLTGSQKRQVQDLIRYLVH